MNTARTSRKIIVAPPPMSTRSSRARSPADLPVEQPTKFDFVDQPQDRPGARADHPAVGAAAGHRGHPVSVGAAASSCRAAWPWRVLACWAAVPCCGPGADHRRSTVWVSCTGGVGRSERGGPGRLSPGAARTGLRRGRDFTLETRYAEGQLERSPELAAELVRLPGRPDRRGRHGAGQGRQRRDRHDPHRAGAGDAVGFGLVASLARPGGNVTGLTSISTQLNGKRLELLKEAVPGVARVAVLWNPAIPSGPPSSRRRNAAARALGLQVISLEVREPASFDGRLRSGEQAARRGAPHPEQYRARHAIACSSSTSRRRVGYP